jgi:Secretion system C-terminal sorting domain
MKNTILKSVFIIYLTLLSSTVLAQNWNPFPIHQKSLYSNHFTYEDIRVDSVKVFPAMSIYYFNNRIHNNFCFNDSVVKADLFTGDFLLPKTMELQANVARFSVYTSTDTSILELRLNASISETWNIAGANLFFRCDSILMKNVFGTMDSVKVFNVYHTTQNIALPNLRFILSKNYGLLSFSAIPKLAMGDSSAAVRSTLLGFYAGTTRKGFVMPDFTDFFKLNKKDVLIWKYQYDDGDIRIPDVVYYYKDSILASTFENDSVTYRVLRNNRGQIDTLDLVFRRNLWESFFILNPSNRVFVDISIPSNNTSKYYDHWMVDDIQLANNYSRANYYWNGSYHHKQTCAFSFMLDVGMALSLDTKVGILSYVTYGFGGSFTNNEVVGSIIDGVASGLSSIPLSTVLNAKEEIQVFPNPSSEYISITNSTNVQSYRIIDLNARSIREGLLLQNSIDVSDLLGGVYFLELTLKNESKIHHKFMHINK